MDTSSTTSNVFPFSSLYGKGEYIYSGQEDEKIPPFTTKILVQRGVKKICDCAFKGCNSLSSIELPSSLECIGSYAFQDCKSLIRVRIPHSVHSIDHCAFSRCSSLKSIELPASLKMIQLWTFDECRSLTSIKIPDSVERIGEGAFGECSSLSFVSVPLSLKMISKNCFSGCSSLEKIYLPPHTNINQGKIFPPQTRVIRSDRWFCIEPYLLMRKRVEGGRAIPTAIVEEDCDLQKLQCLIVDVNDDIFRFIIELAL